MADFTAAMRDPRDRARILALEQEVVALREKLSSRETEVRVWRGRYQQAQQKLEQIRGYAN